MAVPAMTASDLVLTSSRARRPCHASALLRRLRPPFCNRYPSRAGIRITVPVDRPLACLLLTAYLVILLVRYVSKMPHGCAQPLFNCGDFLPGQDLAVFSHRMCGDRL